MPSNLQKSKGDEGLEPPASCKLLFRPKAGVLPLELATQNVFCWEMIVIKVKIYKYFSRLIEHLAVAG